MIMPTHIGARRTTTLTVWTATAALLFIFTLKNSHEACTIPPASKASESFHYDDGKIPMYQNFTAFVLDVVTALKMAPLMADDIHALRIAFPRASMDGIWLEFGVFKGSTIKIMAEAYSGNEPIYGFDSFEGLPEKWREGETKAFTKSYTGKGSFNLGKNPPFEETQSIKWVQGWFNESLPVFLQDKAHKRFSFIHVDCDIYSATKTIFKELDTWLEPGVVIVFDELIHYPEYRDHEIKALFELLQDRPDLGFRIIGTSTQNVQLDVKKDHHPQAVAIQLCTNGNLDCILTDGFRLFEASSSVG